MKNKIFIVIFMIFGLSIFSQAAVDIFDPLYEDIQIWENMGLLNDNSYLKPYPLQEIKRILNHIIEKGDGGQRKIAQNHYNRLFGRIFHFGAGVDLDAKFPQKITEFVLQPFLDINYELSKYLTVSGTLSPLLTNQYPEYTVAHTQFNYSKYDAPTDDVSIGKIKALWNFNTGAAIGTPEYYLTAGIARTSFGPFYDSNIIIGRQAVHQGQFNFVMNKNNWTYSQSFLTLTAKNDFGTGYKTPNKFLTLHSLSVRPLPWLSIGFIETIIYGGRLEPIYFLPFSIHFVSQGLYGFPDNSLLGLMFTAKPISGLRIDGVIYADDIGFNEIVKFKKDAKWRMAGQFGISYTVPKSHWFTMIDLNYTFVTPYCYTHFHDGIPGKPNYENYTHDGRPLGSNLQPNSDRITIKTKFKPLECFDINLSNTFIRHANVTESIKDPILLKDYLTTEKYPTDGSVHNHSAITSGSGYDTKGWPHAFLYSTPFLTQQTIQYINQLGLEGVVNLPILKSGGLIQVKLGYTFEANINPGVNRHIYKKSTGINDSSSAEDILNEANKQLKAWREQAVGKEFNHYFKVGVKISY
ncbi:hypothetical protein E4O05_05900 [Treponema sp. OMZ 787]|uniref:capsule assembly Wzi family protein n=1 Tax=Treponema sp. OMZ 787 TaxID=2563669 RepID=UPI0020A3E8E5|nr:capsule assembly Wzi family protein [Treponema sp. OMZ 787]UTC63412.1 hypothetical protein E4O05_05900 [Treponema sp. OMZ 787]